MENTEDFSGHHKHDTERVHNHIGTWAVLAKTTSASNGMPAWGWVFLGIGAVAGLGALVYLAFFMKPTKQQ